MYDTVKKITRVGGTAVMALHMGACAIPGASVFGIGSGTALTNAHQHIQTSSISQLKQEIQDIKTRTATIQTACTKSNTPLTAQGLDKAISYNGFPTNLPSSAQKEVCENANMFGARTALR